MVTQSGGDTFQWVDKTANMWSDKGFVLRMLQMRGDAFEHVLPQLQADRDVVLAVIAKKGYKIDSNKSRQDMWVTLLAQARSAHLMLNAPDTMKTDKQFVLQVVTAHGDALKHVLPQFQAYNHVVMAAMAQNGDLLVHVVPDFQADKDVVAAAVAYNGLMLQYAHTNLQEDKDVCEKALGISSGSKRELARGGSTAPERNVVHHVNNKQTLIKLAIFWSALLTKCRLLKTFCLQWSCRTGNSDRKSVV